MSLRIKFSQLFKDHPVYCNGVKTQYTFLELVSEINRKGITSISEKDVRSMFLIIDRKKLNSVDMRNVKIWADTGNSEPPPPSAKPFIMPNLRDALVRVCGTTPEFILRGFEYARGQRNVHFDEFRRSMLACGLGQRPDDVKTLFLACGGNGGSADIDKLLDAAASLPTGSPAHAGIKSQATFSVPSRADRKLRQGIRRTYENIHRALEAADPTHTGYVGVDAFFDILQKHCMQTSMQDFRYLMRKVQTHPSNSDKYDWRHFLEQYNPLHAPHELMGDRPQPCLQPLLAALASSLPNTPIAPRPALGAVPLIRRRIPFHWLHLTLPPP